MRATPIAPSPVVLEKPRLRLADYQRMNGWQRLRVLEKWLEENPRQDTPPPPPPPKKIPTGTQLTAAQLAEQLGRRKRIILHWFRLGCPHRTTDCRNTKTSTLEEVREWMKGRPRVDPQMPPRTLSTDAGAKVVFEACLKALGVQQYEIVSHHRTPELIEAREITAAIMRAYRPHGVPISFPEISRLIRNNGRGGHSSIITAIYRWALNSVRIEKTRRIAKEIGVEVSLDQLREETIKLLEGRNNRGTLHWVLPKAYVSPHG